MLIPILSPLDGTGSVIVSQTEGVQNLLDTRGPN